MHVRANPLRRRGGWLAREGKLAKLVAGFRIFS